MEFCVSLFERRAAYQSGKISKQHYIEEMHHLHAALFEYAAYLRDTDIAEITITAEGVVMRTKAVGIKLLCDPADKRIIPVELLNFGTYEQKELDMMGRLMGENYTVWDIGANVGWYSINLAKAFPGSRVLAFEPIPATYRQLQRNVELNQVNNLEVHNFGFSNCAGTLTFYFYPECSGNASTANLTGNAAAQALSCPVKTVDDFAAASGLKMDFVKCDVEGAELFVFQGGTEAIARHQPVIFTEMLRKWSAKFNYHPNQIIELLAGIGYRCFVAEASKLRDFSVMDENTVETNFFFLHTVKHAPLIKALRVGEVRGSTSRG
jgi:FkbM family methyltransferase